MSSQLAFFVRFVRSHASLFLSLTRFRQSYGKEAATTGRGRRPFVRQVVRRLLICVAIVSVGQGTAHAEEVQRKTAGPSEKSKHHVPKDTDLIEMERLILHYTNQERQRHGLRPLASSPALRFLAKNQSKNMCSSGHFQHESESFPTGWQRFGERLRLVRLTAGGENIAYRTFSGKLDEWARAILKGWMKSSEHRRNILNSRFRYVGIGVAPCANKIVYAGQVFSPRPGNVPAKSRDADHVRLAERGPVERQCAADAIRYSVVSKNVGLDR